VNKNLNLVTETEHAFYLISAVSLVNTEKANRKRTLALSRDLRSHTQTPPTIVSFAETKGMLYHVKSEQVSVAKRIARS
jgi:hypothetical protein